MNSEHEMRFFAAHHLWATEKHLHKRVYGCLALLIKGVPPHCYVNIVASWSKSKVVA